MPKKNNYYDGEPFILTSQFAICCRLCSKVFKVGDYCRFIHSELEKSKRRNHLFSSGLKLPVGGFVCGKCDSLDDKDMTEKIRKVVL